MKSEERHELKTNDLRRLFDRVGLQLGRFFETHGNQILLGIVVVLLIVAALIWWTRRTTASAAAGWTEMSVAQTAEDYANVAERFPGTVVGAWARLSEAEHHLMNGIQLVFTDRAAGISDLRRARESFDRVLAGSPLPEDVHERALFGKARCLETMAGVELEDDPVTTEDAIDVYQALLDRFPDTIYQEAARRRIAVLSAGSSQEFYAWFRQQSPQPEDIDRPQDGVPTGEPLPSPGQPGPEQESPFDSLLPPDAAEETVPPALPAQPGTDDAAPAPTDEDADTQDTPPPAQDAPAEDASAEDAPTEDATEDAAGEEEESAESQEAPSLEPQDR